ncbi:PH domain-containing protein [Mucisphaera calidilacus]|uniref:Bacterial membrane flanked domain protein n=1 Tax=Mucisphaera calidilacus TaxID=2527982 RepID=A0A518BXG6_9BACT|nr:PH domain-containing protein [Mucisphaera calidilacus]QDU71644.1 Bacterial membrane flanked domain protein [Mucisphaera calidilacus]
MIEEKVELEAGSAPESKLWRGGPSQILNFWVYVGNALLGLLMIVAGVGLNVLMPDSLWGYYLMPLALLPMVHAGWSWLVLSAQTYELSSQRIRFKSGVLARRTDDLELYRVRDLTIEQPLVYRMLGLGNLVMETSDRSHPRMVIPAVPEPQALLDMVRENVEERRRVTRTREVDFDGGDEVA